MASNVLAAMRAQGGIKAEVQINSAAIPTTGNADQFAIVPENGVLESVDFSGVDALTPSDSNYITFSISNLGQDGLGNVAMLSGDVINTTKATGGSGINANAKRKLNLASGNGLKVKAGDRLRVRAAVTGTLANAITFPVYLLRFVA